MSKIGYKCVKICNLCTFLMGDLETLTRDQEIWPASRGLRHHLGGLA